jgi:hypothetical protein
MHHLLDVAYDYDFMLFGLSCHERDYRLCWFLNNELGIQLEWSGTIKMALKEGSASHTIYRFVNTETEAIISLVSNRSEGSILVPEWRQVDFLFKVDNGSEWDAEEVKEAFQKIDIIRTSFQLDVAGIKNKENLIFD